MNNKRFITHYPANVFIGICCNHHFFGKLWLLSGIFNPIIIVLVLNMPFTTTISNFPVFTPSALLL